jgi:putative transposase
MAHKKSGSILAQQGENVMQYRRSNIPGGTYFFTVVTHQRAPWLHEACAVTALGDVMRKVREQRPFETLAMVVMPDHLHCIWCLPAEDADFSTRWMLIKQGVVHRLRGRMGVQTFWQSRFWEHTLRNEQDVEQHTHYIHFNPVKHGLVPKVGDWPHSTFHRYVKNGIYPADWGTAQGELPGVRE